ncbi:MAG TPA: hypothetical protein VK993_01380 [Chthoniobacterales bacterium]|nr:hypothetical protein [Chthoniobacterales bacterium]
MKSALMTFLLMLATATQPLLAIPASCQMQGQQQAMNCSGCCAVKACCAPSDRAESSPLAAILKSNGQFVPAVMLQPVAVPLPIVREVECPKFARLFPDAHAPPPLALNCIQLI